MKTITKFIFGFPMLALAWGSIAFAQVPLEPLIPPDSALKRAAHPLIGGGDTVPETVKFKSGSAWHLTLNTRDLNFPGLIITDASFQKSPNSPFIYVLFDARVAEIFVPYHSGMPRYRDISGFDWMKMLTLDPAKFAPREIIGSDEKICKEVRDYLAWMQTKYQGGDCPLGPECVQSAAVRYGQEVNYFSVLGAGNYNYIMEWTFRDDGTILARAGSTGPKVDASTAVASGMSEGHMHNFTWRLDIDLNGAGANTAFWKSHSENLTAPSKGTDNREPIMTEGSRVWNPEQYNTLEIQDARLRNKHLVENGLGRRTSYELLPMRSGTARHNEPWTQADFWVTLYNPSELHVFKGQPGQELPLPSLPDYISRPFPTINKDLVIWYTASEHHENDSRDEDMNTVPVIWTGFELDPQNLWDGTPFYP